MRTLCLGVIVLVVGAERDLIDERDICEEAVLSVDGSMRCSLLCDFQRYSNARDCEADEDLTSCVLRLYSDHCYRVDQPNPISGRVRLSERYDWEPAEEIESSVDEDGNVVIYTEEQVEACKESMCSLAWRDKAYECQQHCAEVGNVNKPQCHLGGNKYKPIMDCVLGTWRECIHNTGCNIEYDDRYADVHDVCPEASGWTQEELYPEGVDRQPTDPWIDGLNMEPDSPWTPQEMFDKCIEVTRASSDPDSYIYPCFTMCAFTLESGARWSPPYLRRSDLNDALWSFFPQCGWNYHCRNLRGIWGYRNVSYNWGPGQP